MLLTDGGNMNITLQLEMAGNPKGRMYLHLLSLLRDHKLVWHIKGIIRELKKIA
jgi:hypothetical protein